MLAAAAAKKHMFVEKPLGMAAADAYSMAEAVKQAGVLFQTGYFQRGLPFNQFLRAEIAAGHFGQVTRIRLTNCHAGSLKGWFDTEWRWMADPAQAGIGGFGDLGTHSLDLLLWMMGEVKDVTASIKVVTGRYGDCDETGEGIINFANGAIGTLAAGWVDVAHPVTHFVSGTQGLRLRRRRQALLPERARAGRGWQGAVGEAAGGVAARVRAVPGRAQRQAGAAGGSRRGGLSKLGDGGDVRGGAHEGVGGAEVDQNT